MKNNDNLSFDIEVHNKARLIAKKEFLQYSNCYPSYYQAEDMEHDLYIYYLTKVKEHALQAKSPIDYVVKSLFHEKDKIHKEKIHDFRTILIESEILEGRFEGNNYFELLEGAGKLNRWNDNEKVINTQENNSSSPDRDCTWDKIDSPVGEVEKHEFWDKLESLLSERDYMIILEVKVYGKTEQEVAEKVGLSHQAVHKVIQKLSKFKEDFKEYR